ncbi:MAG: GlsB/YeaQ/YmgE family stress response membrane protein [Myxococcaceae bacterium]
MGLCGWIILGGLAGWLASIFAGTNARQGLIGNIIVGIVGAFVGGMIFNFFGGYGVTGFNLYSLFVAVVGAVVTLGLRKMLFGK